MSQKSSCLWCNSAELSRATWGEGGGCEFHQSEISLWISHIFIIEKRNIWSYCARATFCFQLCWGKPTAVPMGQFKIYPRINKSRICHCIFVFTALFSKLNLFVSSLHSFSEFSSSWMRHRSRRENLRILQYFIWVSFSLFLAFSKNLCPVLLWASLLPLAICKLPLLPSSPSTLLILLYFSLPVKKSEQRRILLLFFFSHWLQRPQLRKQNKTAHWGPCWELYFSTVSTVCLWHSSDYEEFREQKEAVKRSSVALVWFVSNTSAYPLTTPSILSSFGQSQIWTCNFLSNEWCQVPKRDSHAGHDFWRFALDTWESSSSFSRAAQTLHETSASVQASQKEGTKKSPMCSFASRHAQQPEPALLGPGCCTWVLSSTFCCDTWRPGCSCSSFPFCMTNTSPLTPFFCCLYL